MSGYDTILVTTDLSDPSLAAVRHARELASRLGSRLIVAYVVEERLPPLILAHRPDSIDELHAQHRLNAEKALKTAVDEQLAGQAAETIVSQGVIHEEIVRLAKDQGAELIVLGMHGHGFLTHALAGSTAERVLHHAPCPVLIVPHDS